MHTSITQMITPCFCDKSLLKTNNFQGWALMN